MRELNIIQHASSNILGAGNFSNARVTIRRHFCCGRRAHANQVLIGAPIFGLIARGNKSGSGPGRAKEAAFMKDRFGFEQKSQNQSLKLSQNFAWPKSPRRTSRHLAKVHLRRLPIVPKCFT
jgi:hypothetical protein